MSTTILAKCRKTLDTLHRLDEMGGSGTMFGREHIFGELLYEAHERAGETDKGCFCFKKLGWYGNIVSWEPTIDAVKEFLTRGFTGADIEELIGWYSGINASPDQLLLSVYLKHILKRDDVRGLVAESDRKKAETDAAEAARLAAIPHTEPPADAPLYRHEECLEDFAGNHSQPGVWADVYVADDGSEVVTFGGCWGYFIEGDDVLAQFMDGERGCPVEARRSKVRELKKIADTDNPFGGFLRFLEANHKSLRFGEEFRWGDR